MRWLGVGVAAFALQVLLIYGLAPISEGRHWLAYALVPAHLLLLPFLIRNLSFWGMRLVLVGLLLNVAAMAANGGLMPVENSAVEAVGRHEVRDLEIGAPIPGTKNVLVAGEDVRLGWLADTLVLPLPRPFTRAVSVGDLFVMAGVGIAFLEVVRRAGVRETARCA